MYLQLLIFAIGALFLAGGVHFGLSYWQKKTNTDIIVGRFLDAFACLTGGVVFASFCSYSYLNEKFSILPIAICGLAVAGAFATFLFSKKPKLQLLLQGMLCAVALSFVPVTIPVETGVMAYLVKGLTLVGWMLFIYLVRFLDRVPLFSFVSLVCLLLVSCLISSGISTYLDVSFNFLFLLLVGYISIVSLILKKYNLFVLGHAFSFFFSFILGYVGYILVLQGKANVLPVFIAYDLFEFIFVMIANIVVYKKLYPIERMLFIEKTLAKGFDAGLVIKKLFYVIFFLALLGFADLFVSHKGAIINGVNNNFVLYLCTLILLYNTYLTFSSWGKPKPEFKNLFKDLKRELKNIDVNEIKSSLFNRKKDDDKNKK